MKKSQEQDAKKMNSTRWSAFFTAVIFTVTQIPFLPQAVFALAAEPIQNPAVKPVLPSVAVVTNTSTAAGIATQITPKSVSQPTADFLSATQSLSVSSPKVPDGWTLAQSNSDFAYRVDFTDPQNPMKSNEVLKIQNLKTGTVEEIYDKPASKEDLWDIPAISPDGKYAVFATRVSPDSVNLYVYKIGSGEAPRVISLGQALPKAPGAISFVRTSARVEVQNPDGYYSVDLESGTADFVADQWIPAPSNAGYTYKIAVRNDANGMKTIRLEVMNLAAKETRLILEQSDLFNEFGYGVDVSPDGRYVLYGSKTRTGQREVSIADLSLGKTTVLAVGYSVPQVEFSDDAIRLYVDKGPSGLEKGGYYEFLKASANVQFFPDLPDGWTRAASNPNFAFQEKNETIRNMGRGFAYNQYTLSVQDLRTGTVTVLGTATSEVPMKLSSVYDVDSSGKTAAYTLVSYSGYMPPFTTVTKSTWVKNLATGEELRFEGEAQSVVYDEGLAVLKFKDRESKVNLTTMRIEIPQGWKPAKSNPNFAFNYTYGYTNLRQWEALSVQNLQTGKIVELATALYPETTIAPVYDVSPDGANVIYGINTFSLSQRQVFVMSWQGSDTPLAIRGDLKGVSFPNGLVTIDTVQYYPGGTVFGQQYVVRDGRAELKNESLIQAGVSVVFDETNHLVILKDVQGSESSQHRGSFAIYDATAGLNALKYVTSWSVGSGYPASGGSVPIVSTYRVNDQRIVSISVDKPDWSDFRTQETYVVNVETGQKIVLSGYASSARQNGNTAVYQLELSSSEAARRNLPMHREVKVDLTTLKEIVTVPQGWTVAKSNPNFAFQIFVSPSGGAYGPITYLNLMDLKTGKVTRVADMVQYHQGFLNVYDVSPDGSTVIVATKFDDPVTGTSYDAFLKRISDPSTNLSIPGKLSEIKFFGPTATLIIDGKGIPVDLKTLKVVTPTEAQPAQPIIRIKLPKNPLPIPPPVMRPEIEVTHPSAGRFVLESSADLVTWQPVSFYTISRPGEIYTMTQSEISDAKYYRVRNQTESMQSSPDGNNQLVRSGNFLYMLNRDGTVEGKIQVAAEQVQLISYNVMNDGVYLYSNQRGNRSVEFVSFSDLNHREAVSLPSGLSWSSILEWNWISGKPRAQVKPISGEVFQVDLRQNSVRLGPVAADPQLKASAITYFSPAGHMSLGSDEESRVSLVTDISTQVSYNTSASGNLEDFAGGGVAVFFDPTLANSKSIVIGLKSDAPEGVLEFTGINGVRVSFLLRDIPKSSQGLFALATDQLVKYGIDPAKLASIVFIVDGLGQSGSFTLQTQPPALTTLTKIENPIPVATLTPGTDLISVGGAQVSQTEYTPRGIRLTYDTQSTVGGFAAGGVSFPAALNVVSQSYVDLGIQSDHDLGQLRLEIKDATGKMVTLALAEIVKGSEKIFQIPTKFLREAGLQNIAMILMVPEIRYGGTKGKIDLNFFAEPRNNVVGSNPAGQVTAWPWEIALMGPNSSSVVNRPQMTVNRTGFSMASNLEPNGYAYTAVTWENFGTPISESTDLSKSPALQVGVRGESDEIHVEVLDTAGHRAVLVLQDVSADQEKIYSLDPKWLSSQGIDTVHVQQIVFVMVNKGRQSKNSSMTVNIGRNLMGPSVLEPIAGAPITGIVNSASDYGTLSLGDPIESQVEKTLRGVKINFDAGAPGTLNGFAGGGLVIKKLSGMTPETQSVVIGVKSTVRELKLEIQDSNGKQAVFYLAGLTGTEQKYSIPVAELRAAGVDPSKIWQMLLIAEGSVKGSAELSIMPGTASGASMTSTAGIV